jgi:hypothetical protein
MKMNVSSINKGIMSPFVQTVIFLVHVNFHFCTDYFEDHRFFLAWDLGSILINPILGALIVCF